MPSTSEWLGGWLHPEMHETGRSPVLKPHHLSQDEKLPRSRKRRLDKQNSKERRVTQDQSTGRGELTRVSLPTSRPERAVSTPVDNMQCQESVTRTQRDRSGKARARSHSPVSERTKDDRQERKHTSRNWWWLLPFALTAVEELTEPRGGWESLVQKKEKHYKQSITR